MDGAVRIQAQAKLNLGLRVLAREQSGYHQLETIFARLELADQVVVRTGGAGRNLDCIGADVGAMETNLAWRAAVAFAECCGWPHGFVIEVEKRIPVGAGLGGGSADAGAVLRALNMLAPSPLYESDLLRLASGLGADVPYLTTSAPLALAWGRGERILPLAGLEQRGVALLVPPFGVATSDAFAWLAETRDAVGTAVPEPGLVSPEALIRWEVLSAHCGNDLEPAVSRLYPALGDVLAALRADGSGEIVMAGMSGSGSTLFAVGRGSRAPHVSVPDGWRVIQSSAPANVVPAERTM